MGILIIDGDVADFSRGTTVHVPSVDCFWYNALYMTSIATHPLIGATWNILHGTFSEQVLRSLEFLIREKKTDFICLQEAQIEDKINSLLGSGKFPGWKAIHIHAEPASRGHELAMLWNSGRMEMESAPKLILLPTLSKPPLFELLFGSKDAKPTERAAMTARFLIDGRAFRLTTLHAAFEGGYFHRRRQLVFLAQALRKEPAEREILCGDFNTTSYGPLIWRFQQKTVQDIFGREFLNATPNLSWSFDLQTIDPNNAMPFLLKVPLWLRKLAKTRMDYIFGRNVGKTTGELLDLPGSDHRPIIATFNL